MTKGSQLRSSRAILGRKGKLQEIFISDYKTKKKPEMRRAKSNFHFSAIMLISTEKKRKEKRELI